MFSFRFLLLAMQTLQYANHIAITQITCSVVCIDISRQPSSQVECLVLAIWPDSVFNDQLILKVAIPVSQKAKQLQQPSLVQFTVQHCHHIESLLILDHDWLLTINSIHLRFSKLLIHAARKNLNERWTRPDDYILTCLNYLNQVDINCFFWSADLQLKETEKLQIVSHIKQCTSTDALRVTIIITLPCLPARLAVWGTTNKNKTSLQVKSREMSNDVLEILTAHLNHSHKTCELNVVRVRKW